MSRPDLAASAARARHGVLVGAAAVYLVVLPSAHLVSGVVAGAVATAADLALALLVLAGAAELASAAGRRDDEARPPRAVILGLALLLVYGGWVALSGAWGPHAGYAAAKGTGVLALACGAAVLALSRARWSRLADAWLLGAALALAITLVSAAVGPEGLRARVLYAGGAVSGLPFGRVRGPFLHPSMAGDYWVVTAALLWARWPALAGARRRAAGVLSVALAAALLLTVSTPWIGAGVALLVVGRSGVASGGLAFRAVGLALLGTGLAGALVPLSVEVGALSVRTGAVRPAIWASALEAVATSPLTGVGAAPYLAEAPDPLAGGVTGLWDAHNAYLSLLGQFGLVGFGLALGGVAVLARALAGTPASRPRAALLAALAAVGAHALFVASEDFRHVWALLGIVGAWVAEERA